MTRTKVAGVAGLASLALVLTACGGSSGGGDSTAASSGGGSSASAGGASGTVTMWARDNEKGFINLLADAYNKSHKAQVKVTVVPAANFVQKFGTASASGSGPDIASIDLVYLPYFASKGVLEDITDVQNSLPYKDSLSPAHRKLATYQGKTYALPFTAEASVTFWNKDLFKKAGLDPEKPPTNYAEMLADAKAIRALGGDTYGFTMAGQCGGCNVFEFAPHVWASGGDILSEDGKTAKLDSPEVTDALTFYHDMAAAGVMPPAAKTDNGTAQAAAFQSGKVGMVNLGAFFVQTLNADKKVDFGATPIVGKTGGTASFAGGDEIAVTKGAKNKAAAAEFVKWATDEEAQTILAKNAIVPVRTDLTDKIYAPLDPRYKVLGDAMSKGRTPYSVVENAIINDNNGPWAKLLNTAVFGNDVKGAQATAQKAAQQIIDQGN
ncbi:multiple sugar transport system substrate-binding protein [Motilibacter peucedani]|uniref:Multiple sugar transport system substrate-binding protein n=1 Tax=Motilibacter peucedani TaxID=598650 RepID=A0A420XNX2_9ACTN|nr:sugar ABC transporter substrate-binding protein [Motilibacter peucedani]RKS73899.1 multiple sugar transport system substrate-binding protein [Motilibacter peucedani]